MIFNENGEILNVKNNLLEFLENDYKEINYIFGELSLNESFNFKDIMNTIKKGILWIVSKIKEVAQYIGRKIKSLFTRKVSKEDFVDEVESMSEEEKEETIDEIARKCGWTDKDDEAVNKLQQRTKEAFDARWKKQNQEELDSFYLDLENSLSDHLESIKQITQIFQNERTYSSTNSEYKVFETFNSFDNFIEWRDLPEFIKQDRWTFKNKTIEEGPATIRRLLKYPDVTYKICSEGDKLFNRFNNSFEFQINDLRKIIEVMTSNFENSHNDINLNKLQLIAVPTIERICNYTAYMINRTKNLVNLASEIFAKISIKFVTR